MRGIYTTENINYLVVAYCNNESLLIKNNEYSNGKLVRFSIYPVKFGEIQNILRSSDHPDLPKYQVISERQLVELKDSPRCLNNEAINLFWKEVVKLDWTKKYSE